MSADESSAPSADTGDESGLSRLGEGIAVEYSATDGGQLRLTFYADADTADMRQIATHEASADFYDRPENERGQVKNVLMEAIDEHCGDDVSKPIVRAGYEELCQQFQEQAVIDDEDRWSPIVRRLYDETDSVTMYASGDRGTITVRLSNDDGHGPVLEFDQTEWIGMGGGEKIREQYLVSHAELIEVTPGEWETLRDIWHDEIERFVSEETDGDDEIAHEVVRRLSQRINVVEDYDQLRNDTKNALYDRENAERDDAEIQSEHGAVDVLWVQASAITEILDEIPGRSADEGAKSALARHMIERGTLLRGRKTFGRDRLPVWAFDPEPFGGRDLLGADGEDEDAENDDGTRDGEVSL